MYKALTGENSYQIDLKGDSLFLDGNPADWDISRLSDRHYHIIRDHRSYRVEILEVKEKTVTVRVNDHLMEIAVKDKMDLLLERLGMEKALEDKLNDVKAPMPGLILKVEVSEGQEVSKGDPLMILEAMKMENVIKASGDGTVKAVKVKEGNTVEKNQVLIQF